MSREEILAEGHRQMMLALQVGMAVMDCLAEKIEENATPETDGTVIDIAFGFADVVKICHANAFPVDEAAARDIHTHVQLLSLRYGGEINSCMCWSLAHHIHHILLDEFDEETTRH